MGILIQTPIDVFREVERRLKYRFWDKERERSQRAAAIADKGPEVPLCPLNHDMVAYSGPPNNQVKMKVCLRCNAAINEFQIREMGYEFETIPDVLMKDMMNEHLRMKAEGNRKLYVMAR